MLKQLTKDACTVNARGLGVEERKQVVDQGKAPWSEAEKVVESKKFEFLRIYNNVDKRVKKSKTLPREDVQRKAVKQLRLSQERSEAEWDAFDAGVKAGK